mgnify:CR=1 FL=1
MRWGQFLGLFVLSIALATPNAFATEVKLRVANSMPSSYRLTYYILAQVDPSYPGAPGGTNICQWVERQENGTVEVFSHFPYSWCSNPPRFHVLIGIADQRFTHYTEYAVDPGKTLICSGTRIEMPGATAPDCRVVFE